MKRIAIFCALVIGVTGIAVALPPPVAYYSFDSTPGAKEIRDSVSGRIIGLTPSVGIVPGGVSGTYITFSRQGDSNVALGKGYGFTGDFSISFWFRTEPRYADTGVCLIGRHLAGSYNGYIVMLNAEWGYGSPNKITFYHSNSTATSKTSVNDGKWHHVGVVYRKNSGSELYIDGKLEARSAPAPMITTTVDLVLGGITWDKPTGTYTGDLDEFALFDQALSSQDVATLATVPGWAGGFFGESAPVISVPGNPEIMRILLKSGQVINIPTSDIQRIEFGN